MFKIILRPISTVQSSFTTPSLYFYWFIKLKIKNIYTDKLKSDIVYIINIIDKSSNRC